MEDGSATMSSMRRQQTALPAISPANNIGVPLNRPKIEEESPKNLLDISEVNNLYLNLFSPECLLPTKHVFHALSQHRPG